MSKSYEQILIIVLEGWGPGPGDNQLYFGDDPDPCSILPHFIPLKCTFSGQQWFTVIHQVAAQVSVEVFALLSAV